MPRKPKKKTAPKPEIKKRAEKLKAIGALNIDLRKPIKATEAKRINEVYRKLREVADNPKRYVKLKATKAQVRAAKSNTYTAYGDTIYVTKYDSKKEGGKARFTSAKLVDKRIITSKIVVIDGKKYEQAEITDISKKLTPKTVEQMIKDRFNGELSKGHYLMLRYKDNSPFASSTTAAQLAGYVANSPQFKEFENTVLKDKGKLSLVIYRQRGVKGKK
jgi:hypothetical protein